MFLGLWIISEMNMKPRNSLFVLTLDFLVSFLDVLVEARVSLETYDCFPSFFLGRLIGFLAFGFLVFSGSWMLS